MNRIDRLLAIVTALQAKKYCPAEYLAERFSISVRTVYRDIKALGEIGVPLSFEPGRGYFMVRGYFLPPVLFTNDEANALALMETLVMRFGDQSIQRHYTSALSKIKAVLKGAQKEKVQQLDDHIRLVTHGCPLNEHAYLSEIQSAIVQKTILHLHYENSDGEPSRRDVEPIGLIFYALNWHLVGWCWKRKEYRDFRVSRITRMVQTGQPFRKADHITLNEYTVSVSSIY